MELPPLAAAMYKTWWSFASYTASQVDPSGRYAYSVADASAAASAVNRDVYGGQGGYNPIGLSQLYSIARRIASASRAVGAAPDSSPIDASMVAEAPWSRSPADQAALPMWQARVSITYLDESGTQATGYAVVDIPQVLPSSVGSLRAQLGLRVQDQLATPPPTGTPRTGTLLSIDAIQLLQV